MPSNKQYSDSEFWYGYNLRRENKPLYLYDHRYSNANWKGAATISAGNITRSDVANFSHFGVLSIPDTDGIAKHVIIHADNPEQIYGDDDSELIVLWVSTTAARAGEHTLIPALPDSPKIVQFVMKDGSAYRSRFPWLSEFLALDFETAKKIAVLKVRSEASEYEKEFSHFLDIILPGDPTAELAFRLLCEARVACGRDDEKEMGGLKINAPKDLAAWLAPFAVSGDEDQKIAAVVAMMGSETAKKAAKAVFDALERNENAFEEAKVFPGVSELVLSSTPSQEEGAA